MKPIIQCITNNVTMNDCANAVLASGGSPIMAHHIDEVLQVQTFAEALLLNLGATDDYEAMKIALRAAKENNHPVVLDPVGVSGIDFRRNFTKELLDIGGITCIRGNYKEIEAIITGKTTGHGLDYDCRSKDSEVKEAGYKDKECAEKAIDVDSLILHMGEYARKTGILLVASGTTDIVCDGDKTYISNTGDEMMSSITGSGCMLSAIIASRLAYIRSANEVAGVLSKYGDAGKRAADKTRVAGGGIGTFHMFFLDELSLTKW